MKHFDLLISTHLYEKMDSNPKQDLRTAYDLLCSDGTGLGFNTVPVAELDNGNIRAFTNNVECNYSRFVYLEEEIELLCEFLDIPRDRFELFRTVMNMSARCIHGVSSVWTKTK